MARGKATARIAGISGWKDYITRLEINGKNARETLEAEVPVGDRIEIRLDGNLGAGWSSIHDQGCFTAQWGSERDFDQFKGKGPDPATKLDDLGVMPDHDITIAIKLWGNHDWDAPWSWG